jgi:hypothetical protein
MHIVQFNAYLKYCSPFSTQKRKRTGLNAKFPRGSRKVTKRVPLQRESLFDSNEVEIPLATASTEEGHNGQANSYSATDPSLDNGFDVPPGDSGIRPKISKSRRTSASKLGQNGSKRSLRPTGIHSSMRLFFSLVCVVYLNPFSSIIKLRSQNLR